MTKRPKRGYQRETCTECGYRHEVPNDREQYRTIYQPCDGCSRRTTHTVER